MNTLSKDIDVLKKLLFAAESTLERIDLWEFNEKAQKSLYENYNRIKGVAISDLQIKD